MKHCKKLLAIFMAMIMVAFCLPLVFAENAEPYSYDEATNTLTINIEGDMEDFEFAGAPWYEFGEVCEAIVFGNAVTSIGANAFVEFDAVTSVNVPESVKTIGEYAFSTMTSLETITLPAGLVSIGDYAFDGANNLKTVNYAGSVDDWGNVILGETGEAFTSSDDEGEQFTLEPTFNYNYVEPTPEVPSTDPVDEPTDEGEDNGNFFTRLWAKIVAFFKKIGDFFRNLGR